MSAVLVTIVTKVTINGLTQPIFCRPAYNSYNKLFLHSQLTTALLTIVTIVTINGLTQPVVSSLAYNSYNSYNKWSYTANFCKPCYNSYNKWSETANCLQSWLVTIVTINGLTQPIVCNPGYNSHNNYNIWSDTANCVQSWLK